MDEQLVERVARELCRLDGHYPDEVWQEFDRSAALSLDYVEGPQPPDWEARVFPTFVRWKQYADAARRIIPIIQADQRERDAGKPHFQQRVTDWMLECFTPEIAADTLERADRFVEEALELAQTEPKFSAERAHALVDYVFSRPVGEPQQEVGGVMVTLAALCGPNRLDMNGCAEMEYERISSPEVILKIRAKQASKPVGSALPTATRKGDA